MLQKPTVSKICKREPNFSSWVIAVDPVGQFRWLTLSMCLSTRLKWSQKRGYWLGGELPSNSVSWTVSKRDSFKSSLEDARLLWEQWFVDSLNECTAVSPHSCPIMITPFTENTLTGFWAKGSDGLWPHSSHGVPVLYKISVFLLIAIQWLIYNCVSKAKNPIYMSLFQNSHCHCRSIEAEHFHSRPNIHWS